MERCKHFTGIQNKVCKAGVRYDDVCAGGIKHGIPCLQGTSGGGSAYPVCDTCQKREYPTPEELAKEEAETQAIIAEIEKVYPAIKAHYAAEKFTAGVHVMQCPMCGSKLRYRVATYNGHVHAKCENDGCVQFME